MCAATNNQVPGMPSVTLIVRDTYRLSFTSKDYFIFPTVIAQTEQSQALFTSEDYESQTDTGQGKLDPTLANRNDTYVFGQLFAVKYQTRVNFIYYKDDKTGLE